MKIPEILRVQTPHQPGRLAAVLQVIAEAGLTIEGLEAVERWEDCTTWEITVEFDAAELLPLAERIDALPHARVLGRSDRVFKRHLGGKITTRATAPIQTLRDLRDLYTPGVARVCLAIQEDPAKAREYTALGRTVAIVTNGTAVLGLGDIGPVAGLPVMEGKAALFAQLAGLSGVPLLLEERDPARLVEAVAAVAPSFGAIQLEDIRAPECFEVEAQLRARLGIPVLHDDQHGTAVVVLAALLSAARRLDFDLRDKAVGHVGLGAAGIGIARLLMAYGVRRVLGADLDAGARARLEDLGGEPSDLAGVMAEADVVILTTGVPGLVKPAQVRAGQVLLALSNPDPEIEPGEALAAGAAFAADGKLVNNVLAFPGLFRGALDAGAPAFTDAMLFAAAEALSDLGDEHLVPDPLEAEVHRLVAAAVRGAAAP